MLWDSPLAEHWGDAKTCEQASAVVKDQVNLCCNHLKQLLGILYCSSFTILGFTCLLCRHKKSSIWPCKSAAPHRQDDQMAKSAELQMQTRAQHVAKDDGQFSMVADNQALPNHKGDNIAYLSST